MKQIYFRIEYPEGQTIDEEAVVENLNDAIQDIIPGCVLQRTVEGMSELETDARIEQAERTEAKKRSDQDITDTSDEIERRMKKFSDDSLPEHVKYMPQEFREAYKRNTATEEIIKEREG